MAAPNGQDPVRATFVAILQQLNRAESMHEGNVREQTLGLDDLERSLRRFWAIDEQAVRLPHALGLLVRNGLVRAELGAPAPQAPRARAAARYGITAQGKQFLLDAMHQTDRIQ
jgi:hypothetical protein